MGSISGPSPLYHTPPVQAGDPLPDSFQPPWQALDSLLKGWEAGVPPPGEIANYIKGIAPSDDSGLLYRMIFIGAANSD